MSILNISKLTDELIADIDASLMKKAGERTSNIDDSSNKKQTTSVKVASKKIKVDLAESLRKVASDLRSIKNPYDITYDDINNYVNRFKNGK